MPNRRLDALKVFSNIFKPTCCTVTVRNNNSNAIIQLQNSYCNILKAFYTTDKSDINDKNETSKDTNLLIPATKLEEIEEINPKISSLIDPDSQKGVFDENEDDIMKTNQEASWRTMKYSLFFLGASFIGIGSYLLLEFGKPKVSEYGELIVDEYSDMPIWMQYAYRTLKEIDYYKRLIKEPSREKLLPDPLQYPYYQPRYTLVLELIDVLVHPDWTYQTGWRFKKRPGIDKFLETLSGTYEIVVYTAEQGMTVFPIIEALDTKNLISYKLVRDATHFVEGHHVKNLDKLNRNLENVVVIDWNPKSVKFHPENVFNIPRWIGNDDDKTLTELSEFLMTVASSDVEDIREVLKYYNKFDDSLHIFKKKQQSLIDQQETENKVQANSLIPMQHWSQKFLNKPSSFV